RVPEREYRVREALELWRALAGEVLDEAARVVRRVAVAMRADDDRQQPLLRKVLERIVAGGMNTHGQPGRLGRTAEPLGDAPAVARLRAVDDGESRDRVAARSDDRGRRDRKLDGRSNATVTA